MRRKKSITLWLGCILIVCSLALTVFNALWAQKQSANAEKAVTVISKLIYNTENAVLEEREDNTLPSLSIDGNDYVGLIEMPKFDSVLPVRARWNKKLPCPCVFEGSIYDRSLVIGASAGKGQLDFYKAIEVGDTVCFTDMTGAVYSYCVADILYRDSREKALSSCKDSDLAIFIKNPYGFEYIVLSCNEKR